MHCFQIYENGFQSYSAVQEGPGQKLCKDISEQPQNHHSTQKCHNQQTTSLKLIVERCIPYINKEFKNAVPSEKINLNWWFYNSV